MSEPFELKIIDRRGEPKPDPPKDPPDRISDIRDTDDPMVKIAVFPGNRVREQTFKVSRLEARGFKLASQNTQGLGPDGQKAVHAARQKVLKVMQKAARVHEAGDGQKQPEIGGIH